jgi:biotin operon repressor
MLSFFKALADAKRLKIVGLLATRPLTVEQLAPMLGLSPSTVSHHLARLAEAGLVSARAEGYYSVYELNVKAVESAAQRLLARETLPSIAEDVDVDAFDRKVLRTYLDDEGRLRQIPTQRKKLLAILRYLLPNFEPGRRYAEKQVNEVFGRFNEDTAYLRRAMIEFRLMARENGVYWRIDDQPGAGTTHLPAW